MFSGTISEMDLALLGDFKLEKGNHRMEKFKDHLLVHATLNARDQEYFEKIKKAWS